MDSALPAARAGAERCCRPAGRAEDPAGRDHRPCQCDSLAPYAGRNYPSLRAYSRSATAARTQRSVRPARAQPPTTASCSSRSAPGVRAPAAPTAACAETAARSADTGSAPRTGPARLHSVTGGRAHHHDHSLAQTPAIHLGQDGTTAPVFRPAFCPRYCWRHEDAVVQSPDPGPFRAQPDPADLLRQASGEGLSPPLEPSAPHGADR